MHKLCFNSFLLFGLLFLMCSNERNTTKNPVYKIVEIYEGTNQGYIPSIIIETKEYLNKEDLLKIREEIANDKTITKHDVYNCFFVCRKDGATYGLFFRNRQSQPYVDVFESIEDIKLSIQKILDQKKRNIPLDSCYILLKSDTYKSIYYTLIKSNYKSVVDSLNFDYYWANSTGFANEVVERNNELIVRNYTSLPIESDKLILLDSGDYVMYSLKYDGYTSYFLNLK